MIAPELVKTPAASSLKQFEFDKQWTFCNMEIIVKITSKDCHEH